MNVTFLLQPQYLDQIRSVQFSADVDGVPVRCLLAEEQLQKLTGGALAGEERLALERFNLHRDEIQQAARSQLERDGPPAPGADGVRELRVRLSR